MLPLLPFLFNTRVLSTFERSNAASIRTVAIRIWRTVDIVPALAFKPCGVPYVIESRHDYSLAGAAVVLFCVPTAGAAALGERAAPVDAPNCAGAGAAGARVKSM